MSFSNLLRRPSLETGLAQMEDYPGAVLLDVRTPEEYAGGHLPGAVNLPLNRLGGIDYQREHTLFVYCLSGARSARACAWLEKQGYQTVNLGGIMGYRGALE